MASLALLPATMVRDMVPLMPELAAAAGVATIVVGVLHIVFFVLETFMWRRCGVLRHLASFGLGPSAC